MPAIQVRGQSPLNAVREPRHAAKALGVPHGTPRLQQRSAADIAIGRNSDDFVFDNQNHRPEHHRWCTYRELFLSDPL